MRGWPVRRLARQLERLPIGDATRRALAESIADDYYEGRGGIVALVRVIVAAVAAFVREEHPLRFLGRDVRAAGRRLRRAPGFALFSAATLAIVIAAATAVYAVVDAALYRRQPIPALDQIVNIYQSDLRSGASGPMISLSYQDYEDLRASQTVFSDVAAWTRFVGALTTDAASQQLMGEMVTGTYFPTLRVDAALGRTLQPADDVPGAPEVVVLSDGLWRRMFGADPGVIGRSVQILGRPFQIVGVAPAWFRGSDMPNILPTPAWIPMAASSRMRPTITGEDGRTRRSLLLKARLKPDVTVDQARAEVTAISRRIAIADPDRRSLRDPTLASGRPPNGWFVLPMAELRMHESVHAAAGPAAAALMALVGLLMLVGCSNLANLALARGGRRRQEIAVRRALGASRVRLIREQLVESALVAALGWLVALPLTALIMRVFGSEVALHAAVNLTLQLEPHFSATVLAVSLAAAAAAAMAVSLGPAIRNTRREIRAAIGGPDVAAMQVGRWRVRGALVAGQVAASIVLLALSALCVRELTASLAHDPGFDLDKLALAEVDFGASTQDPARVRQEVDAAVRATAALDRVESAAAVSTLPIGPARMPPAVIGLEGDPSVLSASNRVPRARLMAVSGSAFATLGVPIVEGRTFDSRDGAAAPPVAIVSQSLARTLFEGRPAVGQRIPLRLAKYGDTESESLEATIVGVSADTDVDVFGPPSRPGGRPAVFLPLSQRADADVTIVARTNGDPADLAAPMRRVVRGVDPLAPVLLADTGFSVAGPAIAVLQVMGGIAGTLGLFAVALAVTGLYGVLSDVVARRTREIGIRVALGAERRSILRMVLTDGMTPVAFGLAAGLGLAYLSSTALPAFAFLRQLKGGQIAPLAAAAIPLTLAAIAACYMPARRAACVDPNVALREL